MDRDYLLETESVRLSQREKRSFIFHVLYMLDSFDYDISASAAVQNVAHGFDIPVHIEPEFVEIVESIVDSRMQLDESLKPFLTNWRFDRLGVCTKLILRYAYWELEQRKTSPLVVINEAIELAKCFAEKDAYRFINGILDEAAKKLGYAAELLKASPLDSNDQTQISMID